VVREADPAMQARVEELEEENKQLKVAIEELRSRLEKLQALADMQGTGPGMKDFLEKSGLAGLLGNRPLRNVFFRLYADALRRMREYADLLEIAKTQGRGPVDVGHSSSHFRTGDMVASLPRALDVTAEAAATLRSQPGSRATTPGDLQHGSAWRGVAPPGSAPATQVLEQSLLATGMRARSPTGAKVVELDGWDPRQPLDGLAADARHVVLNNPRVRAAESRLLQMIEKQLGTTDQTEDLRAFVLTGVPTPLHSRPATAAGLPPIVR